MDGSTSPAAIDRPPAGRRDAGFLLLEALVALAVAGLVFGAAGAALARGWRDARASADVLAAVTLARADIARIADAPGARSVPSGFALARAEGEVALQVRPDDLAPAPRATPSAGGQAPRGNDVMPGVTRGTASGASGRLRRVSVTVTTPSGRKVSLETVKLDAPPN